MNSNNVEFSNKVIGFIRTFVPQTKLIDKSSSTFHRFIGFIMFFNKTYMKSFWTTIGYTIAQPTTKNWHVLLHEGVHIVQAKKYSRLLFSFLYLFPQIFALLAIFAPILSWWWLLALLFLLPLPAPFRMYFELEAYRVTLLLVKLLSDTSTDVALRHLVKEFTGPNYFFMWPFENYIKNKLNDINHNDEYTKAMISFLRRENLLNE